jgi:hypothetical protein
MKLTISEGNSKIGRVPNVSMTPIVTCRSVVPCHKECYAMKSYRMYPNVRTAWDGNYQYYMADPQGFFRDFILYLVEHNPQRFRMFVGGDVPDKMFFAMLCEAVTPYPGTSFLMFTKRYDLPFEMAPDNLKVVLSTWPGLELPDRLNEMPIAWQADDLRRPVNEPFISCPGACDACGHQCWSAASPDLHIVFTRH